MRDWVTDLAFSPDLKKVVVCRMGEAIPMLEGWHIVPIETIKLLVDGRLGRRKKRSKT